MSLLDTIKTKLDYLNKTMLKFRLRISKKLNSKYTNERQNHRNIKLFIYKKLYNNW